MKIWNSALYVLPLLLVGGIAFANYSGGNNPVFVQEAVTALSSKMSYSFGPSTCKAIEKDSTHWDMTCSSPATPTALTFTIQSADKAPYDLATSFYLTASNEPAIKASNDGLMRYLMIDSKAKI